MATQTWDALVRQADPDHDKPTVAYRFANGRTFEHVPDPYEVPYGPSYYDSGAYYDSGRTYS